MKDDKSVASCGLRLWLIAVQDLLHSKQPQILRLRVDLLTLSESGLDVLPYPHGFHLKLVDL